MSDLITHPLYDNSLKLWTLCYDVTSATNVKDKKETYLPFIGEKNDKFFEDRYENYWRRAPFTNFSVQTLNGLVGLAMMKGISVENRAPKDDYILKNLNGENVGLEQLIKRSQRDALKLGRGGLFVDFPPSDGGVSEQQQIEMGLMATITTYDAFQILDWSSRKVGGQMVVDYVSLKEVVFERDVDSGAVEEVVQTRNLYLDEGNLYYYRVDTGGKEGEVVIPLDGNGGRLNRIPFFPYGSENNDLNPDQPPMYSICSANLNHYQVNADLHSAMFYGVPQYYATGLTQDWVDENLKESFNLGSGALFVGPENSSFGVAEVSSDPLLSTTLESIKQDMISLGAKMINSGVSFSTATEAKIATASENSVLKNVTDNVEQAYNDALEVLALFNKTTAPELTINADLNMLTLDPQELEHLRNSAIAGLIPDQVYRDALRANGLLDMEEIDVIDNLPAVTDLDG